MPTSSDSISGVQLEKVEIIRKGNGKIPKDPPFAYVNAAAAD